MKRFIVTWAEVAGRDLERIVDFIAAESPVQARASLERIEAAAGALVQFPARGRVVPELKWQGIDRYRELQVPPWRVVYRIEGRRVFVVAVLDSRRSLEDVLLDRFLER